jgi:hypothetical protein
MHRRGFPLVSTEAVVALSVIVKLLLERGLWLVVRLQVVVIDCCGRLLVVSRVMMLFRFTSYLVPIIHTPRKLELLWCCSLWYQCILALLLFESAIPFFTEIVILHHNCPPPCKQDDVFLQQLWVVLITSHCTSSCYEDI